MKNKKFYIYVFFLFIYNAYSFYVGRFVSQSLQIGILMLLLILVIKQVKSWGTFGYDDAMKRVYKFYLFWLFLILIRGFLFNFASSSDFLLESGLNPYVTLAFLVPLVAMSPVENFPFKQYVKFGCIMCVVTLFLVAINKTAVFETEYALTIDAESDNSYVMLLNTTNRVLAGFSMVTFLLFLPKYIKPKTWSFVFLCSILTLIITSIAARRGSMALQMIEIVTGIFFYLNKNKVFKAARVLFIVVFCITTAYILTTRFVSSFDLLSQRLYLDSRSFVEDYMVSDFNNHPIDWFFGRGMHGWYNCPFFSMENGPFAGMRTAMETGYLFIILNGGIIWLVMYLYIFLRAAYMGWFRSNNQLTKAFAIYLVIAIASLVPFGLPSFSFTDFLYWIGVAICSSSYYRNLTDEQVKQIYFS